MKPIVVPAGHNYIGVFLTFGCSLNCSYCINHFEKNLKQRPMISGKDWVRLLNRIDSRPDLPVSLQGGEPSLHPDFLYLINHLKPALPIDILTNLSFDIERFMREVKPERLKRDAPYASIRVSYHPETMDLAATTEKVLALLSRGYSIGIWSLLHPGYRQHVLQAQESCKKKGIDFRLKEFLGEYQGKFYGTYKYPGCCSKAQPQKATCKTTELLIDPEAKVFRCHHDIYRGASPIGSLFDQSFSFEDIYRPCDHFGFCNPCDVKVKTNRFQQFGHTSVDIQLVR